MSGKAVRRQLSLINKMRAWYWCLIEVRSVWYQIEHRELFGWVMCAAIMRFFAVVEGVREDKDRRAAFDAFLARRRVRADEMAWFIQLRQFIAHNDGPEGKAVPRVAWSLPVERSFWVAPDIRCPMLVIPPDRGFESTETTFARNLVEISRIHLSDEQRQCFDRMLRAAIEFVRISLESHEDQAQKEEDDALRVIAERWLRTGKGGT